jgi:hypothetical protein
MRQKKSVKKLKKITDGMPININAREAMVIGSYSVKKFFIKFIFIA